MSQHHFETVLADRTRVAVVAGWDRMLQEYFLRVTAPRRRTLFDSLECPPRSLRSVSDLEARLTGLGIELPEPMRRELEEDGALDAGNKVVRHRLEQGVYRREVIC